MTQPDKPEPRRVEGGCQHGCGYGLPCPGKHECVYWDRGQWVGPTRYALDGEHTPKETPDAR
jgi:hypothetical protein